MSDVEDSGDSSKLSGPQDGGNDRTQGGRPGGGRDGGGSRGGGYGRGRDDRRRDDDRRGGYRDGGGGRDDRRGGSRDGGYRGRDGGGSRGGGYGRGRDDRRRDDDRRGGYRDGGGGRDDRRGGSRDGGYRGRDGGGSRGGGYGRGRDDRRRDDDRRGGYRDGGGGRDDRRGGSRDGGYRGRDGGGSRGGGYGRGRDDRRRDDDRRGGYRDGGGGRDDRRGGSRDGGYRGRDDRYPEKRRGPSPGAAPRGPDDLGGDQIEGRQAVREALIVGRRKINEIYLSPLADSPSSPGSPGSASEAEASDALAEITDLAAERRIRFEKVSRGRLESLARTESPQGIVALADPIPPTPLEELLKPIDGQQPLLVVADGVTDPGNLGAILRTAEVAGATGVILARHRAVRLTPTAVKAASGAVEHLRIALVGGLPAALAQLTAAGVWILGLDGNAPQDITTTDMGTEPTALVVGSEGKGLSLLVRQRCDLLVSIAKHGKIDSLNVAAATAVALYEMIRERTRPATPNLS